MARHSFIQMSKLSDVKGRISYISDPKRQEHLYATFSTREDMTFWNDLAKECQEEFKRFGTEGKWVSASKSARYRVSPHSGKSDSIFTF